MALTTPERPASQPDPAASMSLLRELMSETQHTEFDIAAEHSPHRVTHRGVRASVAAAAVVALVGLVIGAAVSQVRKQEPAVQAEKKALAVRITKGQHQVNVLTTQKAALTSEVEILRKQVLADSALGRELEALLTRQQAAAGYTSVAGSGASVTLTNPDPNKPLPNGVDPSQAMVLDSDVQLVVNGLWQQGATSISINGIRLTSTTAIRSAGGAILVSYRPVLSPYVINAIGPATLAGRFKVSTAGQQIAQVAQAYGISVLVTPQALLHIPASTAGLPNVDNLHVTLPLPSPKAASNSPVGGTQ